VKESPRGQSFSSSHTTPRKPSASLHKGVTPQLHLTDLSQFFSPAGSNIAISIATPGCLKLACL